MATAKGKLQEKEDDVVIEEEVGVIQRTIEHRSPSTQEKRKRDEDGSFQSPNKYRHSSDGHRSPAVAKQDFLTVPFWKQLNNRQPSVQFHTREIGSFSLLTRDDKKECFEDQRYLRGKFFLS